MTQRRMRVAMVDSFKRETRVFMGFLRHNVVAVLVAIEA